MNRSLNRRTMLRKSLVTGAALSAGVPACEPSFHPGVRSSLLADESNLSSCSARVERLAELLVTAARSETLSIMGREINQGAKYQEVLAALLLAGAREIQPRPSVGFKFHAVLAVISYHLIGQKLDGQDRWLPLFWGLDYFKSAQDRDIDQGDWKLEPVNEDAVPGAEQAGDRLIQAMQEWDESAADAAAVGVARHLTLNSAFELFYPLGARDFRSIGHKAIYVMCAERTLRLIGWQHAEPVLRSLAYALLMHEGGNPADRRAEADRPWRRNQTIVSQLRDDWMQGAPDLRATSDLLGVLRNGSSDDAADAVVDRLNSGLAISSIWDAVFCGAAELQLRLPNIVSLHAVTTTRAIHHAFRSSKQEHTQRLLLLQNASLLPLFRQAAADRGELSDDSIEELEPRITNGSDQDALESLCDSLGSRRYEAAEKVLGYLSAGRPAKPLLQRIRQLTAVQGNGAHDFKFASAAVEGYRHVSDPWRQRFLACGAMHFRGPNDPDNATVAQVRSVLEK